MEALGHANRTVPTQLDHSFAAVRLGTQCLGMPAMVRNCVHPNPNI